MTTAAVFLDRDGVLNRTVIVAGRPHPPRAMSELELLDGAAEACVTLHVAGLPLVLVTNQPDIARGVTTAAAVDEINEVLAARLALDAVLVCPHDDTDGCGCRKPAPGLLVDGARRTGADLTRSVMVGDRWRDVEAGKRAGCATVFVDHGYAEPRPDRPDVVVGSLAEAVPWILHHTAREERLP